MPGDGLDWANGISLLGPNLTLAVLNGSVPIERLDDMVLRIVATYVLASLLLYWYKLIGTVGFKLGKTTHPIHDQTSRAGSAPPLAQPTKAREIPKERLAFRIFMWT
jgi:hypothetical protein